MKLENFNGNFVNIEGFDNYMVSDIGTVYSKISNKLLSPGDNGNGYLYVQLCLGEKRVNRYIHKLVAEAFIEKPSDEYTDVHHLNHCKTDNRVENLRWITRTEHISLHTSKAKIAIKCLETGKIYNSLLDAANDLDLRSGNISRHLQGVIKHVKGYHFEKVDLNDEI